MRFALIGGVGVLIGLAGAGASDACGRNEAVSSRIRSDVSQFRAIVEEGCRRSLTFRRLAEFVDGSDGLVFIEPGRCSVSGVKACLLLTVHEAAGVRYLRINVSMDVHQPDDELIALIGHELQHAREVLEARWVRSTRQAVLLFYPIGRTGSIRGFETDAARHAGDSIARELSSARAPRRHASR